MNFCATTQCVVLFSDAFSHACALSVTRDFIGGGKKKNALIALEPA